MRRFRIVTYNIHKGRGLYGRTRIERIAQVLGEIGADIVALQEVVTHEESDWVHDQARYLAERLGYFHAVGETRRSRMRRGQVYCNATLSRWPLETTQAFDLSVPRRTRRGALRTDIRVSGKLLHVFNVHLGIGHFERQHQAERLVGNELLRAVDVSGGRILMGDFNEWTKGLITRRLKAEFRLTDLRLHLMQLRAYPSGLPLLHLDHIYFDHHFDVAKAFHHRSRLALVASDHLPLVADLHLREH